jgi:hypothetical protein
MMFGILHVLVANWHDDCCNSEVKYILMRLIYKLNAILFDTYT